MIVKLMTEHHLEFLSLTGGCIGLSESTIIKMTNCCKSHVVAHVSYLSMTSGIITIFVLQRLKTTSI